MRRFLVCFILILYVFPVFSRAQLLPEVTHPLARLAVISFLMPKSKSDSERLINVVDQIERSLLSGSGFSVNSLEEYKSIRQATPKSLDAFWSQIDERGIINPFNVRTSNSQVFESIVEFEVMETQRILRLWEAQGSKSIQFGPLVESMQILLNIYQSGAQFRNRMDESTRILEDTPILGWLRKAGQNIVNPMVRRVIYSESVLNVMRSQLKSNFHKTRQGLAEEGTHISAHVNQFGQSVFESLFMSEVEELEFLKPLKSLNRKVALELVKDFFGSLPEHVRRDIVWYWISHPNGISELVKSPTHSFSFYRDEHPHAVTIVNHFLQWSQDSKIAARVQELSGLPLLKACVSLAKFVKADLLYSELEKGPRFLGEANHRNWLGKTDMNLKFYLDHHGQESSSKLQFSLSEFIDKYPIQAKFIKKRIAAIVLHNAFASGLRSVLSEDVRIFYSSSENSFDVHIMPIGSRDAHPMDDTKRFIESIAKLPIKPLEEIPANDLETFVEQPENLRWLLQMYQLKNMVGEDILKSEMGRYLIRHPYIVSHFLRKKWVEPKIKSFFNGQGNRCPLFYKSHGKISN